MKSKKLSPTGYAVAAFLLLPFAVVLVVCVVVVLAVLTVAYWPVVPFAVYAATRPERKSYGRLDLTKQEPASA